MTTRDALLHRFEDAVERRDKPAAEAALAAMPANVDGLDIRLTVLWGAGVDPEDPDEDDYWFTLADRFDEERTER